jgi:hypothetical protein
VSKDDAITCKICGKPCAADTFLYDSVDFYVGQKVRFVQGNRALSGKLGVVVEAFQPSFYPGLYVVNDGEQDRIVRHDHLMFDHRIETNIHYRELYQHRLVADSYEYTEMRLNKMTEEILTEIEHITVASSEATKARLDEAKGSILSRAAQIDEYHKRQDIILTELAAERTRQNLKFTKDGYDDQHHSLFVWDSVLGEEKGEVSNAILTLRFNTEVLDKNLGNVFDSEEMAHIREELVQTAAVCVAIIERIDARDQSLVEPE